MNDAFLMWVAGAGVLATLVLAAVVALRRSRREAARRQQAEAAALERARQEAERAAAERAASERAAAQKAAAEAEERRQTALAARREAELRAAAEAAERAAIAEARAAVEAAYREGERLAAERAAEQAARQAAEQGAAQAAQRARQQAEREAAAVQPQPAPPPPSAPAKPRPRSPEETLVMVADDSKVVRVKTSRLLAQHRYRVVLAEDGQQAAQLIEQEVPLVLITDVEMPHMDGFELTRHVRQHPLAQHIPIIMITSADERLKAEAAEAGVTLVLGKPYEEAALLACITQAMAGETTAV